MPSVCPAMMMHVSICSCLGSINRKIMARPACSKMQDFIHKIPVGKKGSWGWAQVTEHLAGKLIVLSSKSRNSYLDR
jgi:hypothetical protein